MGVGGGLVWRRGSFAPTGSGEGRKTRKDSLAVRRGSWAAEVCVAMGPRGLGIEVTEGVGRGGRSCRAFFRWLPSK